MTPSSPAWRIPDDQRLVFEEFEDGILLFDARVGSTHLINATAAESLEVVRDTPGLTADAIRARVLERLALPPEALPQEAVEELLVRLADLCLVGLVP